MLDVYDQVHTEETTPMALSDSALPELLDALRVGEGTDLVRELAQWALQALIDTEAAEKIGAGRYERSEGRVTHRNGTRPKTLSTKAGDLVVGIPKLRKGSFFPRRPTEPATSRYPAGVAQSRPIRMVFCSSRMIPSGGYTTE